MSIHEAAELTIQAGALSEGGDVFLLEMGQPVRIRNLAEDMIRLAGLSVRNAENPFGDIAISIIGRRPGKKIHEELFYDPASAILTKQPMIFQAAQTRNGCRDIHSDLVKLTLAFENEDEAFARRILFDLVFERSHERSTAQQKIVRNADAREG